MRSDSYLRPLTGLRFFAALHVVGLHLLADGHLERMPAVVREILAQGYMAVGLFFVLSGFILTYTYLGDGTGTLGPSGKRRFWVARFARVYPVYVLGLVLTIPFYFPNEIRNNLGQAVAAIALVPTMLQGWSPTTATLWNPPAWSLSAELFFYLIFPAIAPWLARRGTTWLLGALLGTWALAFVGPIAYQMTFPSGSTVDPDPASLAGMGQRMLLFGPIFHVPEFLLGIVLGHLFIRHPGLLARKGAFPALVAGLTLVGAVAYLWGAAASGAMPRPRVFLQAMFVPVYGILVWSLAVGGQGLARLLALPVIVLLGEASYSLYLLHIPVIWSVDWLLRLLPNGRGTSIGQTGWFFLIDLALAVGLSVVVFLWVERPCRIAIRRRFAPSHAAEQPGKDRQFGRRFDVTRTAEA